MCLEQIELELNVLLFLKTTEMTEFFHLSYFTDDSVQDCCNFNQYILSANHIERDTDSTLV